MRLSIAVNDMARTTSVYRDVLGFKVEGETGFSADKATRALTGLSKADVRRSRVQAPGSTLSIEFVEYKGVDRAPLRMRIQDRGAARLQVRAQNVDALVAALKTRRPDGGVGGRRRRADPAQLQGRARRGSEQLLLHAVCAVRQLRAVRQTSGACATLTGVPGVQASEPLELLEPLEPLEPQMSSASPVGGIQIHISAAHRKATPVSANAGPNPRVAASDPTRNGAAALATRPVL